MARDYNINGEVLVRVRGGPHLSGQLSDGEMASGVQLGLTDREGIVRILPQWIHRDVRVDDFGPEVPAEVQWQLASLRVTMTLVHFDRSVLSVCMQEAMGGTADFDQDQAGVFVPAGQTLGRYKPLFSSGNHYLRLYLTSPNQGLPWRIASCYLEAPPLEIPIGTRRTHAKLSWRAIPYAVPLLVSGGSLASGGIDVGGIIFSSGKEILSSGIRLWDHVGNL